LDAEVAALTAMVEEAERTIGQLRQAIVSRETVDQAKGVVMAAYRLDDAAAWALLSRISQDHNVTVVDLARAVSPVRGRPLLDGQLDPHSVDSAHRD
jgi:AmiR/NasT family two-component response regulator